MKEIRNTITGWEGDKPGRCVGNSTRQIDYAIQLLFDGYIVEIRDHYENGNNRQANTYLFDRVIRRIKSEHVGDYGTLLEMVKWNLNNLTIQLI